MPNVSLTEPKICTACGSNISGRWESLSPGLCRTLIKFYTVICKKQKNEAHLLKECGFSVCETNNFQKLRYFALVTKSRTNPGHWLLTWQGRDFIRGQKKVHRKVFIFHNKIQQRSETLVSIAEAVKADGPFWLQRDDFLQYAAVDELTQHHLF